MDRGKEIELAANSIIDDLNGLEGFDRTDMINMFGSGVTWGDEHPIKIEGCDFCKQLRGINHKSDECYLIYDGKTLYVDVDIPLSWGSATGYYGFDINFCPMCGRKLNEVENNENK
ncbi:hypothetical protein NN761_11115 [Bacteroides clarus]|uniref:hypothetical protein n=1 Tax=Bacteroides clarus TaxID=626929 RepID=UPI0021013E41|nr:hypothetical protein [Bacteroides clarus]MCQ1546120.1 hypothetical protein [Bacteroides clarus]